jgi:hypothetical protein
MFVTAVNLVVFFPNLVLFIHLIIHSHNPLLILIHILAMPSNKTISTPSCQSTAHE